MIRRVLFTNIGWKALAIGLAVLLWFIMVRDLDLITTRSAPVLLKNMPRDLFLVAGASDPVQLELVGPPNAVTAASLAETAVLLDLKNVDRPGDHTFTLSSADIVLPRGVAFRSATPSQVRLRFDRLAEKDVPVRLQISAGPPDGYRVKRQEITPDKLRVQGPASRVKELAFAVTDDVDLSTVVSRGAFSVNTFLADPHVRLSSPATVKVMVEVERQPAAAGAPVRKQRN